ncbi:hypothetical protein ABZ434_27015 [Streptomyces sp. NPDC005761]|uniref:hypothetical protein n=1 Tax=unclassified Streptomyces TaxID=2593676 RepID=UPI00340A6BD2
MTRDTGSIPRMPTEVPEVAKKPRAAAPGRTSDHHVTDSLAVDAGPTGAGATGTGRKPDDPPAGQPHTKTPAAAPLPGDGIPAAPASDRRPSGGGTPGATRPLFPGDAHDRLSERLQHAVSEFVESPTRAVEEAERTFDTVVAGLTEALEEHRRSLGTAGRDGDPALRTEELRVTLQHYRDLTERLLNV